MILAISSILGPLCAISCTISAIFSWLRLSFMIWGWAKSLDRSTHLLIKILMGVPRVRLPVSLFYGWVAFSESGNHASIGKGDSIFWQSDSLNRRPFE